MEKSHYVYTLAYPDRKIFYVGKGQRNRIDEHEQEAMKHERKLIDSLPELTNQNKGVRIVEVTPTEEDKRYFGASIRRQDENGREYYSARK